VPVVTICSKTLYASVIGHVESRRIVHVNITDHLSDVRVARQLREETPFGAAPKHRISDHDSKFAAEFARAADT